MLPPPPLPPPRPARRRPSSSRTPRWSITKRWGMRWRASTLAAVRGTTKSPSLSMRTCRGRRMGTGSTLIRLRRRQAGTVHARAPRRRWRWAARWLLWSAHRVLVSWTWRQRLTRTCGRCRLGAHMRACFGGETLWTRPPCRQCPTPWGQRERGARERGARESAGVRRKDGLKTTIVSLQRHPTLTPLAGR